MHRLVVGDLNGLGHGVREPHTKLSPSDLPSRWSSEIGQGGSKKRPQNEHTYRARFGPAGHPPLKQNWRVAKYEPIFVTQCALILGTFFQPGCSDFLGCRGHFWVHLARPLFEQAVSIFSAADISQMRRPRSRKCITTAEAGAR